MGHGTCNQFKSAHIFFSFFRSEESVFELVYVSTGGPNNYTINVFVNLNLLLFSWLLNTFGSKLTFDIASGLLNCMFECGFIQLMKVSSF